MNTTDILVDLLFVFSSSYSSCSCVSCSSFFLISILHLLLLSLLLLLFLFLLPLLFLLLFLLLLLLLLLVKFKNRTTAPPSTYLPLAIMKALIIDTILSIKSITNLILYFTTGNVTGIYCVANTKLHGSACG